MWRQNDHNNKDIFTPGRGIIIKDSNDKIIGAFINGIGVSEENAWSLKNRSHQKVTGYDFHDWFNKMGITYDTDKKLAACKPEEIIKKFFRAQEEKNTQLLDTYEDKETLYRYATSSVPYHELYSKDGPKLMMGSGAMELDNVKLINIKKVQNLDADVYNKYYDVTYKASYKDEPDEGTKTYPVTFHMTYESKGAGWKIKSRGH